ncbi:hypothetical protein ABZ614_21835 [Streptomyces sp. NPDC013178]|uniref:hypothetical protein n=1 Tax=unclassified Streptomyces TaxID=2593676 RepID=UPI0033C69D19
MNFRTPLSALFPGTSGRVLTALVAQLSRDLGNVVVHRAARDAQEAQAMGGRSAVRVFPPGAVTRS